METSDENKRNCWLIIQRVYLRGSWGRDKRFVLEMDFQAVCWAASLNLCKQMWRICSLNLTLKSLFSFVIVHITWPIVRYIKTTVAAMRIEI